MSELNWMYIMFGGGAVFLAGFVIFLTIKLKQKLQVDNEHLQQYLNQVAILQHEEEELKQRAVDYRQKISQAQEDYQQLIMKQTAEIDSFYETTKQRRLAQLQSEIDSFKAKSEALLQKDLDEAKNECDKQKEEYLAVYNKIIEGLEARKAEIEADVDFQRHRLEALLNPLIQYEKDEQQKRYYTVQIPDEYHSDIDYLLTTVAQQVQHPDIISKLVWAEYVKPYMDDTIKRAGIKEEPGIYKITNIETGKCYIGKSTNVKKRLQDHFKSSVGITSIADQAVHHAMLNEGLWNWSIEVIIYCDKDKLNELEKYYIEFFKAQEYGYNKTGGG